MKTTMKFSGWFWTCDHCSHRSDWYTVTCFWCWSENITSPKTLTNL